MYLVLTALLALNVSNEILNAFKTLSSSIDKSNASIDQKNVEVYNQILENEKQPGQRDKVKPFREKADEVVKEANAMVAYLNDWKKRVVLEAGGYNKEGEDTLFPQRMDNIDATTILLCEKKGGDTLKEKILKLREFMLSKVMPKDTGSISPLMPLRVETPVKNDHNPKGDWSIANFEHMPAIAALALFSKYQNDVRTSEALVVNKLFEEAHGKELKFDSIVAIAVPKTSYALQGDKVEASILLAAFNPTNKPIVSIAQGGGTKKEPKDGVVEWETIAEGNGPQTVKGTIKLVVGGGVPDINRNFSFDYTVGSTGASMQLDKMNVFYIGVPNPISISAAGYSVEDVYLELPAGSGATQTGEKGHFEIKATKPANKLNPLLIDIYAKSKDPKGSPSKISTIPIRVKFIPDPIAKVGGIQSGPMKVGTFRIQIAPVAELKDFDFDAKFIITSFTFNMIQKESGAYLTYKVSSNNPGGVRFSDNADVAKAMSKAKVGDKIFIEEIRAKGPDGTPRNLSSIILSLVN